MIPKEIISITISPVTLDNLRSAARTVDMELEEFIVWAACDSAHRIVNVGSDR